MKLYFWWDDLAVVALWALVIPAGISLVNWKGWAFLALLVTYKQLSLAYARKESCGE